MDGIHDLGGKLGFGHIVVSGDEEPPFHAPWEERMWGISLTYSRPTNWTSPKFRYTRELETPVRYLERPYLDQWYKAHACMLLGSELLTLDELAAGESDGKPVLNLRTPMSVQDVQRIKHKTSTKIQHDVSAPRYLVGDSVRTSLASKPDHTRLPAYARGHCGVISAYHGGHPLDDAAARGESSIEPLYTVMFEAGELFPEQINSPDRVHLELWESYLRDVG
jgi:nitrile hydratase subunit beta